MKMATEGAEWATVVKGVRLSGGCRAGEQVLSKKCIWWTRSWRVEQRLSVFGALCNSS
jgi:hypothetical protein